MTKAKATRGQLERSEELLRLTGEAAGIGWWVYTVATGAVEHSEMVNRIHGLEGPQEWDSERAVSYYVDGPEKDELMAKFGACLTDGTPYEVDFRIRTEQGQRKWIRARGQAHRDAGGVIDRVIGSFQDVDEEKRANLALAQREFVLQRNFDDAPYGMAIANPEGRFVRVSRSLAEMLGYTRAELAEMGFVDVTHPDDRAFDQAMVRAFRAGSAETFRREKRYVRKDGRVVWADVAVTCVRDEEGAPASFHAQLIDTTAARQAQAREQRLEILQDKAREMERFAYIASHDLRQPVLTLKGYLQALKEDFGEAIPPGSASYLDIMEGALARMDMMIKGLLDYSRISKAKELQSVSLGEVVEEVLADLSKLVEDTGAVVERGELPEVLGYPLELRQLLQNLIANALLYRRAGVRPHVRLKCDVIEGGHRFCVEDNGRGISPGDRERIFGLFQRAKANMTGSTDEGTGIGLANCRLIVERHGGQIEVESEVGVGSTFSFTVLTEGLGG